MKKIFSRWKTVVLVLALVGMFSVVVRTAMAGPSTTPRPTDVAIAAREVQPTGPASDLRINRPEGDWVGGLGVVEPAAPESRLAPAVPGRIARILVQEGQRVEAGALLVELESATEQAALAAAQADVAVAEAELARARAGVRSEDLEALSREAEAARVRAEASAAVAQRLEAAAPGGGVTADELDRAQRQAEADRLTAETAGARRRAGVRGRPVDVRLAEAQLEAAVARRQQAEAQLERLRIVAPVEGEILEVHYRIGEYVQPGGVEPVIVMGDTRTLRARIDVDERDVGRVVEGAQALVTVDAYPERRFEGRVIGIGRRMGRKNVRTDEPTERIDTKILEVVVDLGEVRELIVGQRVMGYLARPPAE
jgi:ABC exporter DevB family membrane fusion protein